MRVSPEPSKRTVLRSKRLSTRACPAGSIEAAAQGVKGIWLLLAAAADARIAKVWLDRTPPSLVEALHNTLNAELSDAVIPGFILHWDLSDLVKAMGLRQVLWTDPTNWMGHVANAGPQFRYRWVLGDLTERMDAQDEEFLRMWESGNR